MTDYYANKELRKNIRQNILQQRRALSYIEAFEAGKQIMKKLVDHPHFQNKRMVGSYLSLGGELSTEPINEYLLEHHCLALPFMNVHERGHMDFYSYKKGDALIENRYHILEPENSPSKLVIPDAIEALIVPLVGFDIKGNRLGMGGGYYDRMLKKLSAQCVLIGVAYDFQLLESVPVENWDMPLDEVITPTHHYKFN